MKKIILAASLALSVSFAQVYAAENRVTVVPRAQTTYNAGTIAYAFQLLDTKTQKNLAESDLQITNTKILHLIAYDASRNEFNHVHPSFDGTYWNVELNLSAMGNYFIWAQGQLKDGTEFSTFAKARIVNGKPEIPVVALKDIRKGTDRSTVIELDQTNLKAGQMAMINFKITRDDGQAPQITPYLGSIAHVIAVAPDGQQLVHVHPMAGAAPNTGMIHTNFPTEGDYRVWIQLLDRGELKVIPLSVVVSK